MNKRVLFLTACLLVCAFLANKVSAMDSTNYRLDWYTPLTGSGGSLSSTNYKMDFTVGQSVSINLMASASRACMGYWCGIIDWRIFLPLILRN